MKKGISVWAFDPKRPLPEVFQKAREAGFDGVEVAIAEDGPITPETTPDECRSIIAAAKDAGIELTSLASGLGWKYPLTTTDADVRARGIALTRSSLQIAASLGLDTILLVPGGVGAEFISGFPVTRYDIAYDNAQSALKELAPEAERTGVAIGVENVWNKFLLSPRETQIFLDDIDSPQVGSYFDVGNVILTGYPEQWIPILGSRIKKVHFKDFKRSVGTLAGFCDLRDGDVNWPAVMSELSSIGYDDWVTAEFFNCEQDLTKISQAMDTILGR